MFLYLTRAASQTIILTANENRGTLNSAVITLEHIDTEETITLTKANTSTKLARFDSFVINTADIASLPEGDFLYTVKAAPGGDIDDSLELETGRGRIIKSFTETVNTNTRTEEAAMYVRS
jgi:hypothetical protein